MVETLDKFKMDIPEAGTEGKAKITKIEKGTIKDFIKDEEALKNWRGNIDAEAINLHIVPENDDMAEFTRVLTISKSRRSNLAKYIKRYGNPEVGQEVKIEINEQGFWNLVL